MRENCANDLKKPTYYSSSDRDKKSEHNNFHRQGSVVSVHTIHVTCEYKMDPQYFKYLIHKLKSPEL
jgi:hypothetical protein